MIRRKTGIVVMVFLGLVLVALLVEQRPQGGGGQSPTPAPEPIWELESSEIVGITVEDLQQGQVIELTRDEQDLWRMVRPEAMPVDPARVERAVSWLAAPRPRAEIFDAPDLTAFELDDPHFRIQVTLAGGDQRLLTVGREAPTGGSRYALSGQRLGVLVFSTVGLDEVLLLAPDLVPTATPQPTATLAVTPEATQEPTETSTVTSEATQEAEE